MLSAQSSVAISPHRPPIAALFDLADPAERFMVETMQRFHCEHPGLYVAHAMKRIRDAQRERVVIEVASFHPKRRNARAEWMLILWNIDDVSIWFRRQTTRQAALAAYRVLVDGSRTRPTADNPVKQSAEAC